MDDTTKSIREICTQGERREVPAVASETLAAAIREIIGPVMAQMADIMRRNSEAMERIASQQQAMTARVADLERQIRLKTPLSKAQEKHVNDAIRARAAELLAAKGTDDRKAITKLAGEIRGSVLARYGVATLREAPAYDYETAMEQARTWNNMLRVREIARSAREKDGRSDEQCG